MRTKWIQAVTAMLALAMMAACSTGAAPPDTLDTDTADATDANGEDPDESDESDEEGQVATEDAAEGDEALDPLEVRMSDDEPEGEPTLGGRLQHMIRLEADDIDPATTAETSGFVIVEQIYESLVENVRDDIHPAIAEEWEISEDGMTYTFYLDEGVYFHSGRQLTADDVQYSLERLLDPDTMAPRAESFAAIQEIEAVDDHTVALHLDEPSAPLLTLLSTGAASIVDQEVVEEHGLNSEVPAGTGPFMIADRVTGQEINLDRHEQYREDGVPYLDGIDISYNPDDAARAAAIQSGDVDFLWRAAPEFIDTLKLEEGLKWYGGPLGSLSLHVRLNTLEEPWDDERVRQATFHAVDRQELLDVAYDGYGEPLNAGYLPQERFGSLQEDIYGEPDLELARELLADAGYPDGFDAELLVISTSAFQVRQTEVLQQQLAEIGINIELEVAEPTVANDRVDARDYDMYQSGFSLTSDPDERFTSSFLEGGGLNYSEWHDDEYEELVVAARTELDEDERERLYQEAETILAERGPVIMTFRDADWDVVASDVMGYDGDPTPSHRFYRYLWLDR